MKAFNITFLIISKIPSHLSFIFSHVTDLYIIVRYLADFKGTVVAITHDRYFLENSCGWILELDRGKWWNCGVMHWLKVLMRMAISQCVLDCICFKVWPSPGINKFRSRSTSHIPPRRFNMYCYLTCIGEGIPHEGNYSSWLEKRKNRMEAEKKQGQIYCSSVRGTSPDIKLTSELWRICLWD